MPSRGADRLTAVRARVEPKICELIDRAKESGDLRPDFEVEDFAMLVEMISAVGDATHDLAPGLWRRYLRIILDGMETARAGHRDLGPSALSRDQLDDVMCGRPPELTPTRPRSARGNGASAG